MGSARVSRIPPRSTPPTLVLLSLWHSKRAPSTLATLQYAPSATLGGGGVSESSLVLHAGWPR
eukprot:scaffold5343_cov48-Phaeocystis_antarctica.AAC.7